MAKAEGEAEREGAKVWTGHEALKKVVSLVEEIGLPGGLFALEEVVEVGYVAETGYIWITQKKKVEHEFKLVSKLVSYDTTITGFLEKLRIRKLKGVKTNDLLLWPPVGEIKIDDPPTGKIHFKSFAGITKTFPVDAFAVGQ